MAQRRRGYGTGTVSQRKDGRWIGLLRCGKDENGTPIRLQFLGRTRKEVEKLLTKAAYERQQGLQVAPDRQTLGELLTHWLEHTKRPKLRPKSYANYKQQVELHILVDPTLAQMPITKLTPEHLERYRSKKLSQGYSARTVNLHRMFIRAALNQAVVRGRLAHNVAEQVEPVPRQKRELKVFTEDQARTFLEAARGTRHEALLIVALTEGPRQGEILGLTWNNVDLDDATLSIDKAVQRVSGKLQFVPPKTQSSKRTIAISRTAVEALRSHRIRQIEDRLLAGPKWHDLNLVFSTVVGTPLEPSGVVKQFKRVLMEASLPDVRFHDLRHACGSLLNKSGVSPKVIQEKLGHADISTTLGFYTHTYPEQTREAAAVMDRILQRVVAG